ncbi:MAG: hypothetical protein A3J63_02560 [Candidatus Moranbacteria bacterium RIFCSPHIGHO2_02_FULL_40_12b]|nr:MAG: hypothetical protein A3J63_02560 [Candidatus Moranbacteria bacterium RIFCSPHIGHO2_02_FULL_40_12b]OGI23322.1 MAG: hypothetical protein A3E91_00020 [Candidatus Moranbacteria bacterium RIFCSPHIGHO2_12_FULL_40_10]
MINWNPFKKKNNSGVPHMGFLQRLAMKKLEKMSPEEREKITREAMKPENMEKIQKVMEQMESSGQFSEEQMNETKKK